ncbi:YqcI/YcgG family protein [Streptomyces sp. NPDC127079]|uniref:YqcI/YcgG family protein n=1 Tax=Streptomyces sp. NPDC127079 TaxID=3347132 RepID=UPI00365B1973
MRDEKSIERLLEIFVTSVCIAEQYSVALKNAYKDAGYRVEMEAFTQSLRREGDVSFSDSLREIRKHTARVARVITFYELDRLPVDALDLPSLSEAIPVLHASIIRAFANANVPFRDAFREKVTSATDSRRFERYFDPGTAPCLDAFRRVQENTACPFAPPARLWGAPTYDATQSVRENLRNCLPILSSFTRVAQREVLDGFVFAFPVQVFGGDVADLSRLLKTFISFLMANDPAGPRTIVRDEVLSPDWHFSFAGEDYFVNVLSPRYGNDHTRYTHGVRDYVFVVLQPDASFHARIPTERSEETRRNIREAFENIYQGYEHQNLEAHRFILPASHADTSVAWYDAEEYAEVIGGYTMPPDVE